MINQKKTVAERIVESLKQFTEELEHDDHPKLTGAIQSFMERLSKINEPKITEAFPWSAGVDPDDIEDANGKMVCVLFGWGGQSSEKANGVAYRRRMILEVPNLIELAHAVAAFGDYAHENELINTARKILARIEGKPDA